MNRMRLCDEIRPRRQRPTGPEPGVDHDSIESQSTPDSFVSVAFFMKCRRSLFRTPLCRQFIVGMTKLAPSLTPDGQRAVTVFVLV
jgi:hypothetical protein